MNIPRDWLGGLSGGPCTIESTELIRRVYRDYGQRFAIAGVGGVFTPQQAYDKIRAGSSLVMFITALMYRGPQQITVLKRGLAKLLKRDGFAHVLIDGVTIPVKPGYQVPFADRIRAKAGVPTTAVGLITKPRQAQKIVAHGQADREAAGRAFAPGVVELDRGHGAGLFDAVGDPPVCVDLPVFPQAQVARRDAPVRRDRGRFDDDEAEAAHRTGDIVLVVEIGGTAVAGERRIHVHRRQPYAAACGHATQRDRGEQRRLRCRGRWLHRFGFLGFLGVLGMWLCFAHTPPPYHTAYGGGGAPAWMNGEYHGYWDGSTIAAPAFSKTVSQYAAKKNLPMDNDYGHAADKYMKQVGVSRSQNGNTLQGTQQASRPGSSCTRASG